MVISVVASLLLVSTPTPASGTPNVGAPVEKAKEPKKICKKPDTTGSRLGSGKKVCMTAQEWKKFYTDAN